MKKLIRGIVEFHDNVRPTVRETFARLAVGQRPDTLFIACADSRVVPNLFASTRPGDLFVVRNVGNLIPPADDMGRSVGDESEAAAIEFALGKLGVSDVVVCGHSECGAMSALLSGDVLSGAPNLEAWLRHGRPALEALGKGEIVTEGLSPSNQLSQLNVLAQVAHLQTYPVVRERMEAGKLRLHGWWFDIAGAEVLAYDPAARRFEVIDATTTHLDAEPDE